MSRAVVDVAEPDDLGLDAVRAVAAGAGVRLDEGLRERVAVRRAQVLAVLASGDTVYGVTTGMGAQSDHRLEHDAQEAHSERLLLARAVGGPPWFDAPEVRALVAARLRTFLSGDAGVSVELCDWLVEQLDGGVVAAVPRTGSGGAGEIIPLAHAWGQLAGVGRVLGADGRAGPAPAPTPGQPRLGPKEGIALLAGVPVATGLAALRTAETRTLVRQWSLVAAAEIALVGASRDPYSAATARGDSVLEAVLATVRDHAGHEPAPRHVQAPVSYRVVGPVLAHLLRATAALEEAAQRALCGVTDSPAYLATEEGHRFVGTAGFHGLDLAAGADALRLAVVHAAEVGTARLHRLLDPRTSGLPAQLSAEPGPQAGLVVVHKRAVAAVHAASGWGATPIGTTETSLGQEDVQTYGLEAADRLRVAVDAARQVVAAELLAVHQAGLLAPDRLGSDVARRARRSRPAGRRAAGRHLRPALGPGPRAARDAAGLRLAW